MKKTMLLFICCFAPLSCLWGQQPTLTPVIGGIVVRCTDATGSPVYTVWAQVPDAAQSSIEGPVAMRLIKLNPSVSRRPHLMQLFIYAHECGHHISGDIVAGVFFNHDNPDREMNADRIGIRLLRDEFQITLAQARALAQTFVNNPPIPPYYLPGPQRAQWIVDCYRSNNDGCGHSTATYAPQPAADPDDGDGSTNTAAVAEPATKQGEPPAQSSVSFPDAFKALVEAAKDNFSFVRKQVLSWSEITLTLPIDNKPTGCVFMEADNDIPSHCTFNLMASPDGSAAKKSYDGCVDMVKPLLPGWDFSEQESELEVNRQTSYLRRADFPDPLKKAKVECSLAYEKGGSKTSRINGYYVDLDFSGHSKPQ
jgi:hypothetical protein